MDAAHRQRFLAALAEVRASVTEAHDAHTRPAAPLSQGWVDRRRLLFAEDALGVLETALGEPTLDARALAEALHGLIYRARELAPGHGMDAAARAILDALAEGDPEAPDAH